MNNETEQPVDHVQDVIKAARKLVGFYEFSYKKGCACQNCALKEALDRYAEVEAVRTGV